MGKLMFKFFSFMLLFAYISGANGISLDGNKKEIGEVLLRHFTNEVTNGNKKTLDIDRLVGRIRFLSFVQVPYILRHVEISDFRDAHLLGTPRISGNTVTLRAHIPDLTVFLRKVRIPLRILNATFQKMNVKNKHAVFEVELELDEKNNKCKMLMKSLDLRLGQYGKLTHDGSNIPLGDQLKKIMLAQVPGKVVNHLKSHMSDWIEIPCDSL